MMMIRVVLVMNMALAVTGDDEGGGGGCGYDDNGGGVHDENDVSCIQR